MERIQRIIEPEIHLWGTEFSPKILLSIENIEVRGATELGEILTRGRYKNKPSPYGACNLIVPTQVDLEDRISWMAEFGFMHRDKFEEAGATDIMFWIYWSGMQGSMSFTPKELKMISRMNIPMCIDYSFMKEEK